MYISTRLSSLSNCKQFFENFISLFVQLLHFALDNFNFNLNFAFDCTHNFRIVFNQLYFVSNSSSSWELETFFITIWKTGENSHFVCVCLHCARAKRANWSFDNFEIFSLPIMFPTFPSLSCTHSHSEWLSFNLCTYTTCIQLLYIWFWFGFGFSFEFRF